MSKTYFLFAFAIAGLLCGCDKQTKLNTAKLEAMSRNIEQFEQNQAHQMASIQAELTALEPNLDKMNDAYFEKSHDQAFFFHTNTLYLLLMVDKKIEASLQLADAERADEVRQQFAYYTNQLGAVNLSTAQLQDALTNQVNQLADKVNAETKIIAGDLSLELQKQIIASATDPAGVARQKEILTEIAEIRNELAMIKDKLGLPSK